MLTAAWIGLAAGFVFGLVAGWVLTYRYKNEDTEARFAAEKRLARVEGVIDGVDRVLRHMERNPAESLAWRDQAIKARKALKEIRR